VRDIIQTKTIKIRNGDFTKIFVDVQKALQTKYSRSVNMHCVFPLRKSELRSLVICDEIPED